MVVVVAVYIEVTMVTDVWAGLGLTSASQRGDLGQVPGLFLEHHLAEIQSGIYF